MGNFSCPEAILFLYLYFYIIISITRESETPLDKLMVVLLGLFLCVCGDLNKQLLAYVVEVLVVFLLQLDIHQPSIILVSVFYYNKIPLEALYKLLVDHIYFFLNPFNSFFFYIGLVFFDLLDFQTLREELLDLQLDQGLATFYLV